MRITLKIAALLGVCTMLTHCGYLGGEALEALVGTPAFELGTVFDVSTLGFGAICIALRWGDKHDLSFWIGVGFDVTVSAVTVAYLLGIPHFFECCGLASSIWPTGVAILTLSATFNAFWELRKGLVDLSEAYCDGNRVAQSSAATAGNDASTVNRSSKLAE